MAQTFTQVNTATIAHLDLRNMKPSQIIKKQCNTQKEQLEVCYSLIDHFVGSQEAEWAILTTKQGNTKKNKKDG